MRRFLLLAMLASSTARADDPRDLFGLGKQPAVEPPPNCDAPHTFGCAAATDPLDDESPYAMSTWLPASYLLRLPIGDSTHDGVAHYGLGAGRDETGAMFGGATGLENRWTIDDAPSDNIRTGANDTRIPLTFLDGILVTAGGFAARDRASTGGKIDAQLRRGTTTHHVEAHLWGGVTGDARDRAIAPISYQLRRLDVEAGPDISGSVVATGPLGRWLGGSAWYAAGVAPIVATTTFAWHAARLVDADGDGVPDVSANRQVVTQTISDTHTKSIDWLVPMMARAGFDRGAHAIDLTLIGHASHTARFLANSTMQAAGIDRFDMIGDGIATWRGKWTSTRAKLQLAWHRNDHREAARSSAAAELPQLLSAYVPATLTDDPVLAERCSDGSFPLLGVQCAVPAGFFASGGAGMLVDVVSDRPTATGEIARRVGDNVVRAGATFEDSRMVVTSRFTGGEQQRSLFDGHLERMRYVDGDCVAATGASCDYADRSVLTYRSRYAAAYVEDTFSPEPEIRVNGGMRWEAMWVGPDLAFRSELEPRVGIAWDVLGNQRSRLWVSMGRSHAMLPAGLGPTVIGRDVVARDTETPFGQSRTVDPGAPVRVAGGITPMAQDELAAGFELGLSRVFQVTIWAQGRWLRRGLDTTSRGFDNPGRHGDELPAMRASELVAVEIATSPTAKTTLRAGYLAGRTIGNFPGPFDPRQGVALYDSDDFDAPFVSGSSVGRLPTDIGHRVFIEVARRGKLGTTEVGVASRLSLNSGRPRTAFGITDVGVIPLLERGGLGRGPLLGQANLRLHARWRRIELTLDVFNAFDRSEATNVDEVYAGPAELRPIEGGTPQDLVFLKTVTGGEARRSTSYGLGTAFQAPVSVVVGAHYSF
ncbi:MAG: hypothetical protein AB7O24_05670 [Kofleriaceae bacterium]